MEEEKLIKDAQYRKGLSIAFFNATNAAIELVATRQIADREETLREVVRIRDFFLDEHRTYYATVIAKIGVNYNAEETITRLKSAKTSDELRKIWQSLSEDERRDVEIIKVKDDLKASYEKA